MTSVGAKTSEQKEGRERRAEGKSLFLFLNGTGEGKEEKGAAWREARIKEMMLVPTYVYAK